MDGALVGVRVEGLKFVLCPGVYSISNRNK